MGFDDFISIFDGLGRIPGAFWIDNQNRALVAATEAASRANPHAFEAELIGFFPEPFANIVAAALSAASLGMTFRARLAAEENVFFEEKIVGHVLNAFP